MGEIAESYFPFDAGAGANVTEDQWRKMGRLWLPTGPILGEDNQLEVFADSSGMQVKVKSGKGWVRGHYYESDAQMTKAIAAADPTNPRDDRVVLQADFTANTVGIVVLTGTPAGSPSPPALTQSSSKWEISLAKVRVDAAASTIAANKVTDERSLVRLPGVFVGAKVYRGSSALTFTTDVGVEIGFGNESWDPFGMHDNVTNNIRLTIPPGLGGKWRFHSQLHFGGSTSVGPYRYMEIRKNGSATYVAHQSQPSLNSFNTGMGVSAIVDAVAGDYFTVLGQVGNSGAAVGLVTRADDGMNFFEAEFLGR